MIELFNIDCMEYMATIPDKYFDLAVVDPPYGLGDRTTNGGSNKNTQVKFKEDLKRTNWDNFIPTDMYFTELKRVSKNQIIWGGNYFPLSKYRTFIVWDKMTYVPTMSQVELAVTSFDSPARLIKINSNQINRIHPTQKPVKLYDWIYKNYLPNGGKVIDTHLGSGSNAIAAHKAGNIDFVGCELDKDYFEAASKKYNDFKKQLSIF